MWNLTLDESLEHRYELLMLPFVDAVLVNAPGSLSTMTAVIARNFGNISNLKITDRSADFFEMLVDIEVRDVKHLTNIIAALRADPAISSVDRAKH